MEGKIVGVVAEFNPFHNGHKYQILKILENNPKLVIAVISGNFVQRGEISVLSKEQKARIAIENGYDIVVELPSYLSIQNADVFSEYSVKILNELGVNLQVFGVENDNKRDFIDVIKLQENDLYLDNVKKFQKEGFNYIKSHELALKEYGYDDFYKSNNILAMSYIRSIIKNKFNIDYYLLKRKSVDYNSNENVNDFASASYIRNNINNLDKIEKFIPQNSYNELLNFNVCFENVKDDLFKIFKYNFNVKSNLEIMQIYDFNDTIYNRMNKVLNFSNSYDEFINNVISRNFSKNRIKRLILNFVLEIKNINLDNEIEYIRVIGLNSKGAKYLKELSNDKIYVNWKDIDKNYSNYFIKMEKNAFNLYQVLINKKEKLNTVYIGR